MSFALTEAAILARDKVCTRRMGWQFLQVETLLQPIRKGMGLKPGEKIVKLGYPIWVHAVWREPLDRMITDREYGRLECIREGFGDDPLLRDPVDFVEFFCEHNRCKPTDQVTRIGFRYMTPIKCDACHGAGVVNGLGRKRLQPVRCNPCNGSGIWYMTVTK